MSLQPGTRVGPYEIVAHLGAGGMGEVWRARDTRLDRDVAIKVLPSGFAANEQFLQRFEREAKAISQLSHAHVCTLYDVGEARLEIRAKDSAEAAGSSLHYLVMEYLEGDSLADRLQKGPLPLADVLKYGRQIASALDAAHRRGITHRDLKPGNVMLTKSGAKLLDFGLAKTASETRAPIDGLTSVRTEAKPLTREGTILGTFQYMAPEQLEGLEADARTDIFALGAVLYEMATGRRAFQGQSKTSLIAAIVSSQPEPISSVVAMTPPALDHVVRKCLEKDPDDRWQSAHDVAGQLQWISEAGSQAGLAAPVIIRRRTREKLAWGIAALAIVGLLGVVAWQRALPRPEPSMPASLFSLVLDNSKSISAFALAPDARSLVYSGVAEAGGEPALWVRRFDDAEPRRLAGTERAEYPFWSPDSASIGFSADGFVKRVPADGGAVQTICEGPSRSSEGTWGRDGVILLRGPDGIYKVAAAGGKAELLLRPDPSRGETWVRAPRFLPDGRRFLYLTRGGDGTASIVVASLDPAVQPRRIVESVHEWGRAEYAGPGFLFYLDRSQLLVAQPVLPETLQPAGPPVPISPKSISTPLGWAAFSVSEEGALAYLEFEARGKGRNRVLWLNRQGRPLGGIEDRQGVWAIALSPDGTSIAANIDQDIWLYDVSTGIPTRSTTHPSLDYVPVWSPDGRRYAFTSTRNGANQVFVMEKDNPGEAREVVSIPGRQVRVLDWSSDGDLLLLGVWGGTSSTDIWSWSFSEGKARPFLETSFDEEPGELSPDGRWLAYTSDEAGARNVYLRPFPGPGATIRVSTSGGTKPRWRRDGRELFYLAPDYSMMSVAISGERQVMPGPSTPLFHKDLNSQGIWWNYDVSPDGQRFLVVEPGEGGAISVLVNWPAKL